MNASESQPPPPKPARDCHDHANIVILGLTLLAACTAAVFTGLQWRTAKDQEVRQTRAYVFLHDIRLQKRNDDTFDLIPEWENSGASQTVNMHSHVNRLLHDVSLPPGFSDGDLPTATAEVGISLGPKSIANIAFSQIPRTCLDQFNRRDAFQQFYLWGWASYNDTLTNIMHETRFCWNVDQVIFSDDGRSARLSHTLCDEHSNCADNECLPRQTERYEIRDAPCKQEPSINSGKP